MVCLVRHFAVDKLSKTDPFADDPPPLYLSLLDSLDPPPSGVLPLASVHRLLSTSRLPASTLEHIVTLTAREASSLSRSEFFCALALVALAQSSTGDEPITLESLTQALPNLPLPSLNVAPTPAPKAYTPGPETPGASPWDTAPRVNGAADRDYMTGAPATSDFADGPAPAFDVEAERGYWKKLEKVDVSLVSQKEGWFLQKYTVESDVSFLRAMGCIPVDDRNAQADRCQDGIQILYGSWSAC